MAYRPSLAPPVPAAVRFFPGAVPQHLPTYSSENAAWPARRRCLPPPDRKSTRLNSSHVRISYAVFCLKKKNRSNGSDSIIASDFIYYFGRFIIKRCCFELFNGKIVIFLIFFKVELKNNIRRCSLHKFY